MTMLLVTAALTAASVLADTAPRFRAAKPVFAEGLAAQMNARVRFTADFTVAKGDRPVLRIAGCSAYRMRLNGAYLGYGPARAGRGEFRIGEWPLDKVRPGANRLEIEVAGFNVNNFAYIDQPAFLQAEVVSGDRVLVATGDGAAFAATDVPEMVRKVNRYSFQRPFAEAFRLPAPAAAKSLAIVPVEGAKRFLPRRAELPRFDVKRDFAPVDRCAVRYDAAKKVRSDRCIDGVSEIFKAFPKDGLDVNVFAECQRYVRTGKPTAFAAAPVRLAGESAIFRRAGDTTGFVGLHVKVLKPGRLVVAWGEIDNGKFDPVRDGTSNAAVWDFAAPGEYDLETFEPYTLMWVNVIAAEGCEIESGAPYVREYVSPSARRAVFRSSDPVLDSIFRAARSTFEQNAVDVFTDCPSRERAGWLCDSFFTSRTAHYLTGSTDLERLFIENFAAEEDFRFLPKGILPMCYPSDHNDGVFITTWDMWLILQCEEFLVRGGDPGTVQALLPAFRRFAEAMRAYRNADGLLEKLPSWIFVEWSKANDFVRDVNYPVNMLWARTLEALAALTGEAAYAAEAASVKAKVREQSWNGTFFRDHAVREGTALKVKDDVSETCQYYAFFTGTATADTHPALWKLMVGKFGPRRDDTKTYPTVWRSNAFIGNYLRLELLARAGLGQTILDDMQEQLGRMAKSTGTLWEHDKPQASCCHGFASHAAVFIARDIVGVAGIDRARKTVTMKETDAAVKRAHLELPLGPGEMMSVERRRESAAARPQCDVHVPAGWRVVWPDVAGEDVPDCVDPRVRTYVAPKRVIWKTVFELKDDGWAQRARVENELALLGRKRGQISEGAFGSATGCRLVNDGVPAGILLDFGRELHGGVQIGVSPNSGTSSQPKIRVRFGESVSEAMSEIGEKDASNDHAVRDQTVEVPRMGTIEVGPTGFRFVRLDLVSGGHVTLEFVRAVSLMRPMKRLGAFRSSDERLNRIFETAVHTVHLCCQDYLWDGIKRDRLVWLGDMHPETTTLMTVFGATPVIPESLDYAMETTPPKTVWMNTMAPYSLWFVRNVAEWYRYTGDLGYLKRHADYLRDTFEHIAREISPSNTWDASGFLDWPTKHNPPAVRAGMQALAALTFDDMAFMLEALEDRDGAARWRETAKRFRGERYGAYGAKSVAALMDLAGFASTGENFLDLVLAGGDEGISNFYGFYVVESMCRAGKGQLALDTVRDHWGAMLDMGATSFWEDFKVSWTNNCFRIDELPVAGCADIHGDRGEFCYPGLRHSLCHGWSSWPAAWMIRHVLGIRPLDVGCRTVEVKPSLGDLAWAEGAFALPDGKAVKVRAEKTAGGETSVTVDAPDGVKVVR